MDVVHVVWRYFGALGFPPFLGYIERDKKSTFFLFGLELFSYPIGALSL